MRRESETVVSEVPQNSFSGIFRNHEIQEIKV